MSGQSIGMESFREIHSSVAGEFRPDTSQAHVESLLPRVNIIIGALHPSPNQPKNEAALAFIPKEGQITFWKKFLYIWKTKGLQQAFEVSSENDASKSSAGVMTRGLFAAWKAVKTITTGANSIALFSHTKDWSSSPVRCLAWHPHCNKLAVATRDDTVLVYAGATSSPVTARHPSQRDISCLAWRPMCSAQLAIGCATGAAVWTVDPASLGTRPSASCLTHLPHPTPVNTVCWNPQGKYLASGSAQDSSLYIWNVENREATLLQKFKGGGFSYLTWSPSGDRLFAATPGSVFKIWETRTWSADNWDVNGGHVQSAAWSPCGTKVVFADSVQPTLYCLSVEPIPALGEKGATALKDSSSKAAGVIVDFTEVDYLNADSGFGGLVQDLAWDPRGERLAIIFRATDFVALFRTRYSPTLTMFPCGVLKGQSNEVASTMQFKPEYENGALLTVAWSSGRVQHVPFSFLAQEA